MCGRYVLKASALELTEQFRLDQVPTLHARFNIAPMQAAPIVRGRSLALAQWGLIPRWAKDASIAHQLINARAETLLEKPSFKELVAAHRCIVPADGFYEWTKEGRVRQPHFIHARAGGLLSLAGLWSQWRSLDGVLIDTFTIITAAANDDVRAIHDRMPIFLSGAARELWLSDTKDQSALFSLLTSPGVGQLDSRFVASHVNSVAIDDPRCLDAPTTVQLRLL